MTPILVYCHELPPLHAWQPSKITRSEKRMSVRYPTRSRTNKDRTVRILTLLGTEQEREFKRPYPSLPSVGQRADNAHHGTLISSPQGAEGSVGMSREAAYAFAIGATANIIFVLGATAMLLAFALAYRPNNVSSQQGSSLLQ